MRPRRLIATGWPGVITSYLLILVQNEGKSVGCSGATLLRFRKTRNLHLHQKLSIQIIDRKEFRSARYPVMEKAKKPAGERRMILAIQYQGNLIAMSRGEDISAIYLDLPDGLRDWVGHDFVDCTTRKTGVKDDDFGSSRTIEHRAAQLIVLQ